MNYVLLCDYILVCNDIIKISVKNKMLDKRDIYKESCSGRDKDSGHIKNAKIQVITKKLWYIEVSQRNRHDAA